MMKSVEIRAYNLKPGNRREFHRLVIERSLPLLQQAGIDLVAFGPSLHDEDSYYLIRAFDSLEHRQISEESFYGSETWVNGPRAQILALIESYTTVVIELDSTAVDALRSPSAKS